MYYLFVNWGGCCDGVDSTYEIRVGRSSSVTGPYLDKTGANMLNAGGSSFLPVEPAGNSRIVGPGHSGIYTGGITGNDGRDYFSFHFYDR